MGAADKVDRARSWARFTVEAGYLVLSTVLFLGLNEVFKANYPDTLLEGSPHWSWMAGAFTQTTIFPGAVVVSYCRSGANFDGWLVGDVKPSSRAESLFSFPVRLSNELLQWVVVAVANAQLLCLDGAIVLHFVHWIYRERFLR